MKQDESIEVIRSLIETTMDMLLSMSIVVCLAIDKVGCYLRFTCVHRVIATAASGSQY